MIYIGDANDRATILADAVTFFDPSTGYFQATDDEEVDVVNANFGPDPDPPSGTQCPSKQFRFPGYWGLGQQTSGLIQVHDLVAPLNFELSVVYLQRLGAIVGALLANRDDNRGFPEDPVRGGVMAAWGAYTDDEGCRWWTDIDTSGLFVYAMAAFARRVAEQLSSIAQMGAVRLALSAPDSVALDVEEDALELLCSNLILNAVQHSPRETTVGVSLAVVAGEVELRIEDEGTGIEPEMLPYVFDRFYRSDPSRSRRTGGTGLGLAICKAIVERAEGTIAIASEPGVGTTVIVRLPLRKDLRRIAPRL